MKKKLNNEDGVPLEENSEETILDPDAEIEEDVEEISDEDEDDDDSMDADF